MTDTPAILPCPFCGAKMEKRGDMQTPSGISPEWINHPNVNDCLFAGKVIMAAIERWNRRAASDDAQENL